MKHNMGNTDQVVRALVAVLVSVLYFTGIVTGVFASVLLGAGIIFLLTSLIGSCPLYSLFGINTRKRANKLK